MRNKRYHLYNTYMYKVRYRVPYRYSIYICWAVVYIYILYVHTVNNCRFKYTLKYNESILISVLKYLCIFPFEINWLRFVNRVLNYTCSYLNTNMHTSSDEIHGIP